MRIPASRILFLHQEGEIEMRFVTGASESPKVSSRAWCFRLGLVQKSRQEG